MPPVLGPRSPSKTALWSSAAASGIASCPFARTKKDTSCPTMSSSTTTRAPEVPKALCSMHSAIAASASSSVRQTMAPLPAARPSALTTSGAPTSRQYRRAWVGSSKVENCAVGMPWRSIRFFANTLDPSIAAARALGPKTVRPAAASRSASPATSGTSGPTTVRSMRSRRANATSSSCESTLMSTHDAWRAIPGLPGAANTVSISGLWAIFQASACSRPPPPTSRIFMVASAVSSAWTEGGLRSTQAGSGLPVLPEMRPGSARPFCPWGDPAPHPGTRTGSASRGRLGGLDDLQMGPCDARPGTAGIELEVALPVLDGLTIAAVARQGSGEVEVGVGVVGRERERSAIVDDRLVDCAAVLVERAEVVGGLTAPGILVERRGIRRLRFIVTAHAMQQQTEVVPGGGVCRVDRDDPAVGADCVLPLGRIAVPLAGTLEPRLGLIGGRRQRTHETCGQRGSGRRRETARIECQHHLARSWVEADAIGLGDQPISLHGQPQLGQRMLEARVLPPQRGQCRPDLTH